MTQQADLSLSSNEVRQIYSYDLLDHISIASIVCQTILYSHIILSIFQTAFAKRRQDLAVYFKNSLVNSSCGPKWAVNQGQFKGVCLESDLESMTAFGSPDADSPLKPLVKVQITVQF